MKREELKELFEEDFKEIKVSDELKMKTLKKIEKNNNTNISHFPYLRNICAVFVVSLICFCVYTNKDSFYLNTEKNSEDIVVEEAIESLEQSVGNAKNLPSSQMLKSKSFSNGESYRNKTSGSGVLLDESINDCIEYKFGAITEYASDEEILTEEDFFKKYPNAIKTDKGYIIKENQIEKLYVFENGILVEILEN